MANTLASVLIGKALDNISRSSSGVTRSGTALSTRGIDWLNTSLRKMALKRDFSELRRVYSMTTVASTKVYALPTNAKSVYSMRLIDGLNSRKLILIQPWTFDRAHAYPDALSTGRPIYYNKYSNTFEVYPLPDAAYTIWCRCADWPTTITAATDTMEYTPEKDDALVAGITAEGFRHLQMYDDAKIWDGEFGGFVRALAADDKDEPDWAPMGEGFNSASGNVLPGQYWNNPWVKVGGETV